MPELVFMLTRDDRTVADPLAAYDQIRHLPPLRHVGFKDVGADPDQLHALTRVIHDDGRRAYLEVVAPEPDAELAAVRTAVALGVDAVLGTTRHDDALDVLDGTDIGFLPFPGRVTGHPSRLEGSLEEIVAHARGLATHPGVTGLDLLAFRWTGGDGAELARAVCAAVDVPVVVAGSIDTDSRIRSVEAAGAWGFTVGGAAFAGRFAGGDLRDEVAALLTAAGSTQSVDKHTDDASERTPVRPAGGHS